MSGGGGDNGAEDAARVQADAQRESLNYLKQTERLPQAYREGSLRGLGGEYGFDSEGNYGADGLSIIQRAEASPFYQTSVQRGEEAVLRNASATGGLRSGGVQEALASVNHNALAASYANQLSGLQGMAQLPSNANNIASTISGVGQTLAQGMIGGAQSAAAQQQANYNNAMGLGSLALQGYETFSDERLKQNIVLVGKENGHNIYDWHWNKIANKLGLYGKSRGVIAQEVEKMNPNAVTDRFGFKAVNYAAIGVKPHGI